MRIPDHELEALIVEVLADCTTVNPPLDRNEIAQHVLDELGSALRKSVYAALDRMVGCGRIVRLSQSDDDSRYRYDLAPGGGRH